MRAPVDADRVRRFMLELGRRARGPGRVYLSGGASAVLVGWRASTVDIDLKLDPEPPAAFEAIARLKDELDINVELASPDLFVPVPADWSESSTFIERQGLVDFFHFDFRAQALSKIARGHERDLRDVRAMIDHGRLTVDALRAAFEVTAPSLLRYPGVDEHALRRRMHAFLGDEDE